MHSMEEVLDMDAPMSGPEWANSEVNRDGKSMTWAVGTQERYRRRMVGGCLGTKAHSEITCHKAR